MKTILYNPIFINPQAYYVFPRLTRWLRPDDSYKEPANYIGQIEVTIIAYGEIGYTEYFEHTNYIDFTNFSNSYVRISLFTRLGACVLGEWKIGTMEGDRPYIEPEVLASLKAVVIVGDKTNQDKDRDIIANLVDASNPFIISNAAYKLNSGYGKYEVDFTTWSKRNVVTSNNDNSFSFESKVSSSLLYYSTTIGVDTPSFKIKANISNCLVYYYYINDKGTLSSISILESGEFELPISHNTLYNGNIGIGFEIGRINGTGTGTITQIPSYQGAFVTDGVDDLITSTKTVQEMLGGSNEITVVSMIHQIKESIYNNRAYTNYISGTSGHIRNQVADTKTGIYGYTVTDLNNSSTNIKGSVINNILGDKNDYLYDANTNVELGNAKYSVQNYIKSDGTVSNIGSQLAWYWTIIANKVLTTDQINQVIAYYNLDRCVEPTVLYDVKRQGLSNDTPDSDWYLKDYSGNGYDMTLYNYAKTLESGINEDGGLQSDGVEDYGKVTGLPIYKDYTVVADYERFNIGNIEGIGTPPVLSKSYTAGQGSFIMNFIASTGNSIHSYSFGAENTRNFSDLARQIFYQSKYKSQGFDITAGTGIDGDSLWLGTARDNDSRFFNGAIYSLMTFPYSMSEFLIERQLKKHKLGTLYPDMVEWRPIYTSNVNDYTITKATYFDETGQHDLALGNHYPIGTRFRIYVKPSGAVDEVTSIKVNGVESTYDYIDSNYGYAFNGTLSSKSPQKIDITIDEYIRYEDIVQPYPMFFEFYNENNELFTWGGKVKVGSTITRTKGVAYSNLLEDLYTITNPRLNGVQLAGDEHTVEKQMVFTCDATYIKGSNAPKCILSPSRLRIPNSSYKILGYIPDISGHGNHGKINNSAYALNSGANGYTELEFSKWRYNASEKRAEFTITNDTKLNITKVLVQNWAIIYTVIGDYTSNKIQRYKVTGVNKNQPIVFGNDNPTDALLTITSDGEYEVDWKTYGKNPCIFTNWTGDCNITIEQVGQYEGAYCLDGVDDFITIPTTVGGKQVLMKVNWQNSPKLLYDQRGSGTFAILTTNEDDTTNSRIAYQSRNLGGKTYIDGIENNYIETYSLKLVTHNITITNPISGNVSPVIGCNTEKTSNFARMSLYDFMLFDEIDSDEEILTLNEYVGIEGNTDDLFN